MIESESVGLNKEEKMVKSERKIWRKDIWL